MVEDFISDSTPGGIIGEDKLPESVVQQGAGPRLMGPELHRLDVIAGLVAPMETTMFVTASTWAKVAREVSLFDKGKPTPANFRRLRLRTLTVVNSGSEDQDAVDLVNQPEAERCGFAWKRDHLVSGKR